MFSFPSNKMTRRTGMRTATVLGVAAALYGMAPSARAQQFIGNAYTAQVGVNLSADAAIPIVGGFLTSTNNINSTLSNTGNLLPATPQTRNGLTAGASANVSSGLSGLCLVGQLAGDVLRADVVTTRTTSQTPAPGMAVTSIGSVANVGLINSSLVLDLLGTSSLVTATAVQSTTSADFTGATFGSSIITGLHVNGQAINLQTNADGTVQGSGQVLTVYNYDNILQRVGTEAIGTLTLNEQINNADGSLTTNALHLRLTDTTGIPLFATSVGSKASGDVILGSSTAGYRTVGGAAAPEPGSFALLAMGLIPGAGLVLRARKRRGAA